MRNFLDIFLNYFDSMIIGIASGLAVLIASNKKYSPFITALLIFLLALIFVLGFSLVEYIRTI